MGHKFAALAITGMMALAPFSANAAYESTTPCTNGVGTIGSTFSAVEAAILAGVFTNTRDQNNMLGKLLNGYTDAMTLKDGVPTKYGDAITKLQNISDTAVALANAAKPKLTGADAITSSAYAAQQCLRPPM
jgi:hypothetical protein